MLNTLIRSRWKTALLAVFALLFIVGTVAAQDAALSSNSGLITGLRQLHAWTRWLVVIIAIVAIVRLVIGLVQNAPYDKLTQRIMTAFSGLTSLQWLIGIIFLIAYGSTIQNFGIRYWWEHAVTMTIAVAISHMHNRWKRADDRTRTRNSLIVVIVVLVLVFIGVALLPQGWRITPSA
jgi:nitrogen fixation/metabolism regulation signal transduction histidine kinase